MLKKNKEYIVTDINMRTVRLNTGIEVVFDDKDNMLSVSSPYHLNEPPQRKTVLRYLVSELKKIIN